jgi:predicted O-methyltransferase YrrM
MSNSRETNAEKYVAKQFVKESSRAQAIRHALESDGKLGINVGAAEAGLLQFLLRMVGAKTVVEIGLLYGYSTYFMAEALPTGGKLHSFEKSPENFARAKELLGSDDVSSKIELHLGDALSELKKLGSLQADVIFIDADKNNYDNYLTWAFEHVRVGGLIIGDNSLLWGGVYNEPAADGPKPSAAAIESMKNFNKRIAEHPDYNSILIPTREGMTVGQRLR